MVTYNTQLLATNLLTVDYIIIDDNFFREKFVSFPGLEPQISSFPYWRLNHLGHCDTLTG